MGTPGSTVGGGGGGGNWVIKDASAAEAELPDVSAEDDHGL